MLRLDNEYGVILVGEDVISNIVSIVANSCFGISGMAAKNVTEELKEMFKVSNGEKGISVKCTNNSNNFFIHLFYRLISIYFSCYIILFHLKVPQLS